MLPETLTTRPQVYFFYMLSKQVKMLSQILKKTVLNEKIISVPRNARKVNTLP
jgi:hypothetical protein